MNRPAGGQAGTGRGQSNSQAHHSPAQSRKQFRSAALKVRDRALAISAHELCEEDLAREVNDLADAVTDLAGIVAHMARAGQ